MTATAVADGLTESSTDLERRRLPGDRSRLAIYLFVLVEVSAVAIFLWIGRNQWFFLDEWDFLATRDGGSVTDLLTAHNEHWTTLPIVIYRVLFNVFGLHTYLPYQLVPLLAHVGVAALLLLIILRTGASPWLAAAGASLFALFGSGSQNMVWAFQITFVGALLFGLAQICLADHDGGPGWRDVAAIACGLAALMCSGVGLTMLFVASIALFLRRGWRTAALQLVPLGLVYAAWYAAYGHGQGNPANSSTASDVVGFAVEGIKSTYSELGQLPGVALVFAATLPLGGVLLWRRYGLRESLSRFGVPVTLLGASVVFIASAGLTRADMLGTSFARAERYLYVIAAMSVPAIVVAVDAIARRWPVTFPVGMAVLLLPIPFSVYDAREQNPNLLGNRTVVAVTEMPELDDVPPDTLLEVPTGRARLTLGWLREAARDGKVPSLSEAEQAKAAVDWRFRLALRQSFDDPGEDCVPITRPVELSLSRHDVIRLRGGTVQVTNRDPGGSPFNIVTYHPVIGGRFDVVVPHVNLTLRSQDPNRPAALCGEPAEG